MRVLNRGGFANADVLWIDQGGRSLIVKDWGQRTRWVRLLLAPLLVRHEAAMLERASGLPGVPRPLGRVGRLALAMEHLPGVPLARRSHAHSLPPAFFDALDGIVEGLALRGLYYLDLASPSNVLVSPDGAPALVDLGSATGVPLPRVLLRRLRSRADAKLRRRFEQQPGAAPILPAPTGVAARQLDLGRVRFRLRDFGPAADPVPILFLHDAGGTGALWMPWLLEADRAGRRMVAPDLPRFGGTRAPGGSLAPARLARWLERLLDVARIERVDVVGAGWGGVLARALAVRCAARVRVAAALPAQGDSLDQELLEHWRAARDDPPALREQLRAGLPDVLPDAARAELESALRRAPDALLCRAWLDLPLAVARDGATGLRMREPVRPWLDLGEDATLAAAARQPERLLDALAARAAESP